MESLENRVSLAKLFNELRSSAPMGVVGILEFRNLLSNLFPEFAEVRDEELDSFLDVYVSELTQTHQRTPEEDWEGPTKPPTTDTGVFYP